MPAVSIVIPAYNHAKFLKGTIESALAQTWHDYEIVVVDDGSKDDTPAVAAQFGDAIRYIRQANQGMAACRNTALQNATGDIVSFLDDDDLWLPDYLSTVMARFQADADLAAVHTGYQLTSDEEGKDFPNQSIRTVPAAKLYDTLIEGGFFPPSSVSVRRAILDQVGFFSPNLQGYADWELWLRICREHKFIGVPQVLIKYRIHAGGLSSNVKHMTEDRLRAIDMHFGSPEGDPTTWPAAKRRAYAFAYRTAAFEYSIQGKADEAWSYLAQAAAVWPTIFTQLDTFYELACGNQPRGYRGQADSVAIDQNAVELFARLDQLFAQASPEVIALKGTAYGNANLTLAMLSDQAGRRSAGRRYLRQAIKANPRLMGSPSVIRRYSKLLLGRHAQALKQALPVPGFGADTVDG
jgi:glycosyltransferase involved in cell wall biosynthesis